MRIGTVDVELHSLTLSETENLQLFNLEDYLLCAPHPGWTWPAELKGLCVTANRGWKPTKMGQLIG